MNILDIGLKLFLFYTIICSIFGSIYGIYVVHSERKIVIERCGTRQYTIKVIFVVIVCIVTSIIMTYKLILNPCKFIKEILNNQINQKK
jgi:hypothetical protein